MAGEPVWVLNYRGSFLGGENSSIEVVYQFLRKALLATTAKAPFRGGKYFNEAEYTYMNHVEGGVDRFRGTEFILFEKERVYELFYHGGKVS